MSSHRKPPSLPMAIGGMSISALLKFVGVAVGLFGLIVMAAGLAQTASATPNKARDCTGCHGSGAVAGTVTATPSTTTPAAGASYTVGIVISANPNGGDTGYWIATSNAAGATGSGVVFGGQNGSGSPTYTVPMTAPAAAGTYWYKAWGVQGLNDASGQTNFGLYSITVDPAPAVPALSAVAPTHAQAGASVTITGTNLGTAGTVSFGTTAAATTAWTSTSITATVPALAPGPASLSVTPTGLATSNPLAFTVDPAPAVPALSAVAPTHAQAGASVTITGTNLGTAGTVSFGTTAAATTAWTSTSITATVPALAPGPASLSVTPTGLATSNPLAFTVDPAPAVPALSAVAPTHAQAGASVTITGTNLGTAGTVSFGTTAAATTAWTSTSITATVPALAPGPASLSVTPTGLATSNPLAFTVDPAPAVPALSAVAPTHAQAGASVTITGTNLGTAGTVSFGTTAAATTAWTSTSITATVPALAPGPASLSVTPTGLATSNPLAFTVDPAPAVPALSAVAPTHAQAGASVTITGTNLGTAGTVSFGTTAAATTAWTSTSITATVPALAPGPASLSVTPTGLATSNPLAFTVDPAPAVPPTPGQAVIKALSPDRGVVGSKVTITGTDLGAKGAVTFGKAKTTILSWTATKIIVRVPEGNRGKVVAVKVTPKAAALSNSLPFRVLRGGHEDRHGHGDDEGFDGSRVSLLSFVGMELPAPIHV